MRNAFSPMIRCVAKILPIIIRTCRCICNELGKGRPRLETGTTDDGLLWFLNNRHNPVMVYNDLMIRYISVHNYSKDRSQPVTIQCIHTWVGAPVDRRRQTGMICPNRTLISVRIMVPFFRMDSNPLSTAHQLILVIDIV